VEAASAVKAATAEPRASADEDAAGEPRRPIVAIRRARVWVISIVAVRAHRRTVHGGGVHRAAYSDAHRKSLCMCEACCEQADAQYRQNSYIFHFGLLVKPAPTCRTAASGHPG
jgi:hypothetical protein